MVLEAATMAASPLAITARPKAVWPAGHWCPDSQEMAPLTEGISFCPRGYQEGPSGCRSVVSKQQDSSPRELLPQPNRTAAGYDLSRGLPTAWPRLWVLAQSLCFWVCHLSTL